MLALVKPAALKAFSTLDPLVTTSLNRSTGANLAAVARMLSLCHSEPKSRSGVNYLSSRSYDGQSETGVDTPSSAAATLIEGALPVRDFPSDLTSGPASISISASSSVNGETPRQNSSHGKIIESTHEEELRCVLAIVRHGDRTPKQKLKINISESHILRYFHDK